MHLQRELGIPCHRWRNTPFLHFHILKSKPQLCKCVVFIRLNINIPLHALIFQRQRLQVCKPSGHNCINTRLQDLVLLYRWECIIIFQILSLSPSHTQKKFMLRKPLLLLKDNQLFKKTQNIKSHSKPKEMPRHWKKALLSTQIKLLELWGAE